MIECIFTVDYEIYGNGEGSLKELVYAPAERLMAAFRKYGKRFVAFVEVAELETIEAAGSDPAIDLVKKQIREFHREGIELGLHLHPQWYNARRENGRWHLDYSDYNLCTLPEDRIARIVDRAIAYLRKLLDEPDFTPRSFRAGNWLLQPTRTVAGVLAGRGIKVDSSVFKGGMRHQHGLDYRGAMRNGHYWKFTNQVVDPDPLGVLLELPIHTRMVPFWEMFSAKRVAMEGKGLSASMGDHERLYRFLDILRFRHPLKLDFCRMTMNELTSMIDTAIREDRGAPDSLWPVVAIGHTKELGETDTLESFLSYLGQRGVGISTFTDVYQRCK